MAKADRDKWNARYGEFGRNALEPDSYLASLHGILPRRGRALDVAGGSGRNAVWLARRGLDVTIVDISDAGLALAEAHAGAAGVSLCTMVLDLESDPLPSGPWQVIIDIHFLQRSLFAELARALAPGGYLVFVQPTMSNLERHARPSAQYLLDDGELPGLISGLDVALEIIDYQEGWQANGRHEACFLARRPVSSSVLDKCTGM